jgi:hypothetical protein
MDTSNNIIKFPLIKKGNSKQIEPEEIENNLTMIKYNHIGETLALIIPILINNLELAGFISSENDEEYIDLNIKDGALIVESIKSMLLKHYNIYHPFQDIASNVFEETKTPNEFRIKPTLDIKFKKENES